MLYKKQCSIILLIFYSIFILNAKEVKAVDLNVNAKAAIVLDSKTKIVLYEKNSDMLIPMASTTKIMTCLVALKYGNLEKKLPISKKAINIRGSIVGYKEGEMISIKELLYGLMFRSGNDAAIALAEGIGGDIDGFLKLMNEYALEIGAVNSHFESPHGLDSDNHYCTAYDLAIITSKAKENDLFNNIVSSKYVSKNETGFTRDYNNINKILFQLPEANGVKTGYTGKAGKCLVTSVSIKGHDVIIVVLNCTPRWQETIKLSRYVEKNFEYKKFFSKNDVIAKVAVPNSREKIKIISNTDIIIPCKNDETYNYKFIAPKNINPSIKKGDKVGKLEIYKNSELISSQNLFSNNDVKRNLFQKIWFK